MRTAFVMDPFEQVDVDADTSFALMLEAHARGHEVYEVDPVTVGYGSDRSTVVARTVMPTRGPGAPGTSGEPEEVAAASFDSIWIRTDPPFDPDYLHVTQLLALAEAEGSLVVNKPSGLQAANEHLWSLKFPELCPKQAVDSDAGALLRFLDEVGGCMVLKPIDGHGGEGVVVVDAADRNKHVLIELLTDAGRQPVFAQEYLPAARQGDKRVIVLDGNVLGAVNRVPKDDEHRGNIHVGGRVEKSTLTPREQEICATVGQAFRDEGLWFVGLDLIGEHLTEVNVTSPTGIQEIERFDGRNLCADVWEWAEARVAHRRG